MAVFAVYIQKRTAYHGEERTFGNTYHYRTTTGEPFDDENVANQVMQAERAITSTDVRFIGWKTWGPTDGTAFDSVVREDGVWDLGGGGTDPGGVYREACTLVVWPMDRSPTTNRKRWLRKYLRLATGPTAEAPTVYEGSTAFSQAALDAFSNYAASVRDIVTDFQTYPLCNENGEGTTEPGFARPYMFTRQIGR